MHEILITSLSYDQVIKGKVTFKVNGGQSLIKPPLMQVFSFWSAILESYP